jgi:uncharacterized membrane protein
MEKTEFMAGLQKALRWRLSRREIKEIIVDYEGFFAAGHSEGKSESQISAELGVPAAIAAELTAALRKGGKLAYAIYIASLTYYQIAVLPYFNYNDNIRVLVLVSVVVLIVLVALLARVPNISPRAQDGCLMIVAHSLLLVTVGAFYAVLRYLGRIFLTITPQDNLDFNLEKVSLWLAFACLAALIVAVIIGALALYGLLRFCRRYLTVLCHAVTVIAFIGSITWILSGLSSVSIFLNNIHLALLIYVAEVFISIFSLQMVWRLQERKQ